MSTNTSTGNTSFDRGEQSIEKVVNDFTESTAELCRALDAPESVLSNFISSAEELASLVQENAQRATQADKKATDNSVELDEERDKRSAEIEGCHNRISSVEQSIDDADPCTQADRTTTQADDLTPIEQLSQADRIEEVTDSKSVQRAVSIFKNIDNWGCRTPKGIVLKPADNPLSLLEADQDESLCWKQFYRAAECLEKLSQGSATFFTSDKHGKMICLHEQSEAYQRVVEGELSPSSERAST